MSTFITIPKKIQLIVALAVLLFAAGAWHVLHAAPTPPKDITGLAATAEQDSYWQTRIKAVGGAAAYKEFSRYVLQFNINQRHSLAHIFGGALYQTVGESGLTVCDANFSYGCFHEFLGRAIQEFGLGEVDKLNEGCQHALVTSPLSCQHGIGHGVAAFVGYSPDDLNKELVVCKNLPFNDPIGGCYAGVFMEYNLRTMLGDSGTLRPVTNNDIFAPCDSLGEAYQKACAFWQPQWWEEELYSGEATTSVFALLGQHCDAMEKDPELRRSCYEGIGTIAPISGHGYFKDPALLCDATSPSKLYQLYCRAYAANAISDEVNKTEGQKVCDGLTGASLDYCSAYASNKSNLMIPGVPPELQ